MKQKKYPTNRFIRVITAVVFQLFAWVFRIKKHIPAEVKKLKAPYLLISNHVGFFDPFVIGHLLPHFTHFVSSDAAFRNPVQRFFLTRLGTIPKKKNMRDTRVIRDIVNVIKQGECVGIFPEAVRNWAGSTLYIDASIAKLIKMLDVPVVLSIIKGMNLLHPRWSKNMRYTRLEVDYQLLFTKEEVQSLDYQSIITKIRKELVHDEVAWQREKRNLIRSNHRAENINHVLYLCPECHSIDSFRAKGNNFWCSKCDYTITIDEYGFFKRKDQNKPVHFDNIRDWYIWQEGSLKNLVDQFLHNNREEALFIDYGSKVYHSNEGSDLKHIGVCDVKLFTDRIQLDFIDREKQILFNFEDLQTINPQVGERLEIFYNSEAYRITGGRPGVSALKWEVAVNVIWKHLGMHHKLSPYIRI